MEINWINHFSPASVIMGFLSGMMGGITILSLSENNPRWWIVGIGFVLFMALFAVLVIRDDKESVNYWRKNGKTRNSQNSRIQRR